MNNPKLIVDYLKKYSKDFILFLIERESLINFPHHFTSNIEEKIDYEYLIYKHNLLNEKANMILDKPGLDSFNEYMELSDKADKLWTKIISHHDKLHKNLDKEIKS